MSPSERRRARGVSLVELMVAVALGLAMVAVVLRGYAAASTVTMVNSAVSEYQTNGRYALEMLKREVRHAALHPMVWTGKQFDINATAAARNYGCGAGVSTNLKTSGGVAAWNDSNPFSGSCLAAGTDRNWARGDVMMLRRTALDRAGSFDANAPYVRLSYGSANIFLGGETAADLVPPSVDYRLVSDVYFVNAFTASDTESPKVPALYKLTLSSGANPTLVPQLVASNVEHLQIQYGQVTDLATGATRWLNANNVTDWTTVSAVRVWLLMRASSPEGGFTSGSYEMGDVVYTPNDNYRRTVLSTTINLRNLSVTPDL